MWNSTKDALELNMSPSFRHQPSLRRPPFDERISLMPLSIKYSQISRHSRAAGGSPNPPQRSMVSTRRQKSGGKFRLITFRLNSIFRTFSIFGRQRSIWTVRPHIGHPALHLSVNSRWKFNVRERLNSPGFKSSSGAIGISGISMFSNAGFSIHVVAANRDAIWKLNRAPVTIVEQLIRKNYRTLG